MAAIVELGSVRAAIRAGLGGGGGWKGAGGGGGGGGVGGREEEGRDGASGDRALRGGGLGDVPDAAVVERERELRRLGEDRVRVARERAPPLFEQLRLGLVWHPLAAFDSVLQAVAGHLR